MTAEYILKCRDKLLLLQRLNELKGFSESELRDMGKANREIIENESINLKARIRQLDRGKN